jgi:hypothetical protein
VVKSILANLIGDWNIVTNNGDAEQLFLTRELLIILKKVALPRILNSQQIRVK